MSNLDAVAAAEVVVLAVPANGLAATLPEIRAACRGKIVVSTVVPLTFGGGRLFTPPPQGPDDLVALAEAVREAVLPAPRREEVVGRMPGRPPTDQHDGQDDHQQRHRGVHGVADA